MLVSERDARLFNRHVLVSRVMPPISNVETSKKPINFSRLQTMPNPHPHYNPKTAPNASTWLALPEAQRIKAVTTFH